MVAAPTPYLNPPFIKYVFTAKSCGFALLCHCTERTSVIQHQLNSGRYTLLQTKITVICRAIHVFSIIHLTGREFDEERFGKNIIRPEAAKKKTKAYWLPSIYIFRLLRNGSSILSSMSIIYIVFFWIFFVSRACFILSLNFRVSCL